MIVDQQSYGAPSDLEFVIQAVAFSARRFVLRSSAYSRKAWTASAESVPKAVAKVFLLSAVSKAATSGTNKASIKVKKFVSSNFR